MKAHTHMYIYIYTNIKKLLFAKYIMNYHQDLSALQFFSILSQTTKMLLSF